MVIMRKGGEQTPTEELVASLTGTVSDLVV